jgi:hypothetical protein
MLKLAFLLYIFTWLAALPAEASIKIENECVYKLECKKDINKLTMEELDYLIKAYEIVPKERLTLEEYAYLHPRTRDWKIDGKQLFDIDFKALMKFQNEQFSIGAFMSVLEVALHELKYNFANNNTLEEQIKAFQVDSGQLATGAVTLGQYSRITELAEITNPSKLHFRGDGKAEASELFHNIVLVEGSWDIIGEKEAFPINSIDIYCEKDRLQCTEDYKNFRTHQEKFGLILPMRNYYLDEGTIYYDVISWTDEVIVAKPRLKNDCRSVILNINYITGKVQQIVNSKSGECSLPKLDGPRISELVDSFKFHSQYWRTLENNILCTKARSYISIMQNLRAENKGSELICKPLALY